MSPRNRGLFSYVMVYAMTSGLTAFAQSTGPDSSKSPQVVPVACNVETISLLTVGDSVNLKPDGVTPYRLVGIPDGMGALGNGDGTYTLWVNHELGSTVGVARAHGGKGAFISEWVIDSTTNEVLSGEDLIQNVYLWDAVNSVYTLGTNVALGRLCSADLAASEAYYNAASGMGSTERIYLNGEEIGNEGRSFAHILTGPNKGTSYELPWHGKYSWENNVAHPNTGSDLTLCIGLDDSSPLGQVYLYVGTKTNVGTEIDRSGLNYGMIHGIAVDGPANEDGATGFGAASLPFSLVDMGDVSAKTGATLQADSEASTPTVTEFLRPEDGQWDPSNLNDFYFVTTHTFTGGKSRLWRLRFDDLANPTAGGTIDMLVESDTDVVTLPDAITETPRMMDNMTMDRNGHVLIQEDVGNQVRLSKIWLYDIATDKLTLAAEHSADFFISGGSEFITQDEESSGIIDATDVIGPGWFLINVQAHAPNLDAELVEFGQVLSMYVPQSLPPACDGDANGDNTVDPLDAGFIAARFGCDVNSCDADCIASDVNGDALVDPLDYGYTLARFGEC